MAVTNQLQEQKRALLLKSTSIRQKKDRPLKGRPPTIHS